MQIIRATGCDLINDLYDRQFRSMYSLKVVLRTVMLTIRRTAGGQIKSLFDMCRGYLLFRAEGRAYIIT